MCLALQMCCSLWVVQLLPAILHMQHLCCLFLCEKSPQGNFPLALSLAPFESQGILRIRIKRNPNSFVGFRDSKNLS